MRLIFKQRFFSWFDSYDIYDENMNKKSILLILSSTFALGANAQGKYTINGNLLNADGQKIYLYSKIAKFIKVSHFINSGTFCLYDIRTSI